MSMLNWRRDPGFELRKMRHEQRMKQLESDSERSKERTKLIEKETEQIEKETEQLKQMNAKERALSASIKRLCFPPESSSTPQAPIEPVSKPFLPS